MKNYLNDLISELNKISEDDTDKLDSDMDKLQESVTIRLGLFKKLQKKKQDTIKNAKEFLDSIPDYLDRLSELKLSHESESRKIELSEETKILLENLRNMIKKTN